MDNILKPTYAHVMPLSKGLKCLTITTKEKQVHESKLRFYSLSSMSYNRQGCRTNTKKSKVAAL